jgi:hypothetical protein
MINKDVSSTIQDGPPINPIKAKGDQKYGAYRMADIDEVVQARTEEDAV